MQVSFPVANAIGKATINSIKNFMMKNRLLAFLVLMASLTSVVSCKQKNNEVNEGTSQIHAVELLNSAYEQMENLRQKAIKEDKNPRALEPNGEILWANPKWDWTEGFFPGSCWFMYEHSKDEKWKTAAEDLQSLYKEHSYLTTNHDLGFLFNCSYGNAYRLTGNSKYKEVLTTAADSLLTRFNPNVGCIKSWDVSSGWQAERGWKFPVIIDNMMNLELLFVVSELTGNRKYKEVAVAHANTTLKNHFRSDDSSYHVVDYDPETGEVRSKQRAQGYQHESAWSRGQAWGLYGYVVCYRYTKDPRYLRQAEKIATYIKNRAPEDFIPYWDYDAPNIPNEPKDASAAAITASALLELDEYSAKSYLSFIHNILGSLSSEKYLSKNGENQGFVLNHSVGSIPHNSEIDVPINYADYYYLEALLRYKEKHGES